MIYSRKEYFADLQKHMVNYLALNYDYYYLKYTHERNRMIGAENMILGTSHAMNGVECALLPGGRENNINLSVSSQDLFCDLLHAKKAIAEGKKKIKTCVINMGYYLLYQDLSLSKTMGRNIERVYVPLFGEEAVHNKKETESYDFSLTMGCDRKLYPEEYVMGLTEHWIKGFFNENPDYYNTLLTRENNNILGLKKIEWNAMTEEEKRSYAGERVGSHNSMIRYKESFSENEMLLDELVTLLAGNNIRTIIMITPFTRIYKELIDPRFKKEMLEVTERINYPVEFFDMNELEGIFDDGDFLDTDHLNAEGAVKCSQLLAEYLEMF
ncbi:MAG: hypothetical protein K6B44_05425 [Lachnospiraceae bacterium]|nr:hypothetical protein [Lachnospiraceae bacterium]